MTQLPDAPASPLFPDGTNPVTPLVVTIHPDAAGQRLDRALADAVPDLSRSRLQALIAAGCVREGERTVEDASTKVKPGQRFEIRVPPPVRAEPEPQAIGLDIVYEDPHLIVIDKPAGLVVHPAAGNPDGTLVNALLAHCGAQLSGIGGVARPGIVHRLDKETSGLMVVAKTDAAHKALSAQFADRTLSRTYLALVWGRPSPSAGTIEGAIGRDPRNRQRMAIVKAGGKPARTHYRVLRPAGAEASLVTCKLDTGRTHQIRVHMTSIGHPLIGDPVYGRRPRSAIANETARSFPRQALHAAKLRFRHPADQRELEFTRPLPGDMRHLLVSLAGEDRIPEY
ncbi:RluA family pseudouridine synthase [Inquilinus limosus]|uniref:Pseudouridine synthase n=1 Tax=Inquilinus limosus TaxID=171674 RepID=A0A211Z444_9PROT|nr:RluA family pseudouridine synthase [Inquilinus limosus]OWJ59867.1 RNA pseudouridine synthase [Inquilinus limosus]